MTRRLNARVFENRVESRSRRHDARTVQSAAVKMTEIPGIARHQQSCFRMYRCRKDRRVLEWQALSLRPIDQGAGGFGDDNGVRKRFGEPAFKSLRFERKVALRLLQRVRGGEQLAAPCARERDQILRPALRTMRRGENDVRVQKQLQRLRRARTLRRRAFSPALCRLASSNSLMRSSVYSSTG